MSDLFVCKACGKKYESEINSNDDFCSFDCWESENCKSPKHDVEHEEIILD